MKLLNLTPHDVNIITDGGVTTYTKGGTPPRLEQDNIPTGEVICGTPITKAVFGKTTNLPPFEKDTFLIVSRMVQEGNLSRTDLLSPNELVRDEKGRIIGCKSLSRI
jgi:hypothetical protein